MSKPHPFIVNIFIVFFEKKIAEPLENGKFWATRDAVTISIPRTGLPNQHKQRKPMRHIPSYKPIKNRDVEEGKRRRNEWKKRWHGYE